MYRIFLASFTTGCLARKFTACKEVTSKGPIIFVFKILTHTGFKLFSTIECAFSVIVFSKAKSSQLMFQASKSRSAMLDVNCKNADGLTPLLLVTRDLNLFEKSM